MPYLGYLLAQAVKAGQTVASAITSAASYVTRVGSSVVELSASAEALKSPSTGSAVFSGSGNYIEVSSLNNYSGYSGLTVSAWIYSDDLTGNKTAMSNWGAVQLGNYAWLLFSGQFVDYRFSWLVSGSGTTYYTLNGATNLSEKTWYYITATWSPSSMKLYINGNLDASTGTVPSSLANTQFKTVIGADFDGNTSDSLVRTFDGNMANAAIWSRALSAEEVRSVMMKSYDDLSASETKGLVSWYALDDISGTTVPDSHGNFNGTGY